MLNQLCIDAYVYSFLMVEVVLHVLIKGTFKLHINECPSGIEFFLLLIRCLMLQSVVRLLQDRFAI
jgi:hypothetical protein